MPHVFSRSLLGLALSLSLFAVAPGTHAASEDDDILASVANAEALPADDASSVEELGVPSDVWERIRRGYAMPVLQSKLVDRWVDFYTKDPAYLRRMSERAGQYLYHIVEEIENRGMPTELALLPFVESAFQAEALSRAKAAGLWQFMPATGKAYDLAQNLWRDDRRDVLESTRAALDYFEYLHGMFGDWHLALAAYNWGEGSVQRAIQRAKRRKQPTDYLHLRMPRETANYVPKLEAVKRIISNPARYGITLPDVGNEPFFVTITKPRDIDIETAAELAGMPLEEFRRLNPSYKLPVIVASHNNVMLLPADKLDFFVDNLASWMDSGQPLSRWSTYKLKQGETLAAVAERCGMSESFLRQVNGIPKGRRVLANSTVGTAVADMPLAKSPSGATSLAGIASEYTILFFNAPDCVDCSIYKVRLKANLAANTLIEAGVLSIVSVYPEGQTDGIDGEAANWNVASLPDFGKAYDMRIRPAVYFLDGEKRIVAKFVEIDNLLSTLEGIKQAKGV